jgi:hypothetical protein
VFNFFLCIYSFLRFRSRFVVFRLGFSVQSSSNGHTQVTEKLRKNTAKTEDSAGAHTGQGRKEKRCEKKFKKKQQKKGQAYEKGDTIKRQTRLANKKKTANKNIAGAHTG